MYLGLREYNWNDNSEKYLSTDITPSLFMLSFKHALKSNHLNTCLNISLQDSFLNPILDSEAMFTVYDVQYI